MKFVFEFKVILICKKLLIASLHCSVWLLKHTGTWPGEKGVYPDVGGDDDEEGEEEDLAVVRGVVDVRPVVRAAVNWQCHPFHLKFRFDFIQFCCSRLWDKFPTDELQCVEVQWLVLENILCQLLGQKNWLHFMAIFGSNEIPKGDGSVLIQMSPQTEPLYSNCPPCQIHSSV